VNDTDRILKRLREARERVNATRAAYSEASQKAQAFKAEWQKAVKEQERLIAALTDPCPLFDQVPDPEPAPAPKQQQAGPAPEIGRTYDAPPAPTDYQDWTAEREERLRSLAQAAPLTGSLLREAEAIADYRERQRAGTAQSSWDRWSEFTVIVGGNLEVDVVYNPTWSETPGGSVCFEFHGPLSTTGFRSHIEQKKHPRTPVIEWAQATAQRIYDEHTGKARGRKTKGAAT
jgi:hypothetical protein